MRQDSVAEYHRHVSPEQICPVLEAHCEGSRWRGISHISGLAYNTIASIVRARRQQTQQVHKTELF